MDDRLVGKTILAIFMAAEDQAICFELMGGEKLYYRAEGDCCAYAYYYQWQNLEDIVGYPVTEVSEDNAGSVGEDKGGEVTDICFYTIKTARGQASFEFRVDHNGYYGGCAVECSEADADMGEHPKELARAQLAPPKSVWDRLNEN